MRIFCLRRKSMPKSGILWRGTGVILMLLLGLSLAMLGQERFGNLTGVVSDPSGAVLQDVRVTITNRATDRVFTATTRVTTYLPDFLKEQPSKK